MTRRRVIGLLVLVVGLAGVLAFRAEPAAGVTVAGFFIDDNGRTLEEDIDAIAAADITRGCNPPANNRFCPTQSLTRGEMAAFLVRALNLPGSGTNAFSDDNGHLFETEINALAAADITRGCNPPANTRYCPDRTLTRGEMAALLVRALSLPPSGTNWFGDDNGHLFETEINALAAADITRGCNPPANSRYCPDRTLTRGEMAALLVRALGLPPSGTNWFGDDNGHLFETEINALAAADITRGCNPPTNSRFCPNDQVTREQMAAFIRRALDIPYATLRLPMGEGSGFSCKSTSQCRVTYDVVAGRQYQLREGHFLVQPATGTDSSDFGSSGTRIEVTLNGSGQSVSAIPEFTQGSLRYRMWSRNVTFTQGTHTLVVTWRWDGDVIRRTVATVRAG